MPATRTTGRGHNPYDLLRDRADRREDALAVVTSGCSLTFGQLLRQAAAVRSRLSERDVGPGSVVAAATSNAADLFVAATAALAAGAAIRPIAEFPHGLVRLLDGEVDAVVHGASDEAAIEAGVPSLRLTGAEVDPAPPTPPGAVAAIVDAGAMHGGGSRRSSRRPTVAWSPGTLATSASGLGRTLRLRHDDRVLAHYRTTSDLLLVVGMATLAAGATLVASPPDARTDRTGALVPEPGVTVWAAGPLVVAEAVGRAEGPTLAGSVRTVVLTRGRVPAWLTARLLDCGHPPEVVHTWGTPETGGLSTVHRLVPADARSLRSPIGVPLPDQTLHVLHEATLAPCPTWVTGRLHYGGRGLAIGFPLQPQLEYEHFVTHPETRERLFASAERGRRLPSGEVELVGTPDTQPTVAGDTADLRDLEARIEEHPAVEAAAVVPTSTTGVAAQVRPRDDAILDGEALRAWLRGRVPDFLVPREVAVVGDLPLDASGSLDRAALAARLDPAPSLPSPSPTPAGRTEQALCELVRDTLGLADDLAPTMNLLDLGASSVELIRVLGVVEERFGFAPDLEELLAEPSITTLVRQQHRGDAAAGTPPPRHPRSPRPDEGLILDPVRRSAFMREGRHRRTDLDVSPSVPLPVPTHDGVARRRSTRRFSPAPVPHAHLCTLLAALREDRTSATRSRRYPSAGGAYPVQAYVAIRDGGVDGIAGGVYWYDPEAHRLVPTGGPEVPVEAHAWINRVAFEQSAFSIYLVAERAAIDPLYGRLARDFCLVEAGAMAQLLAMVAAESGLGLCSIGEVDEAHVEAALALRDSHEVVHALIGGLPAPEDPAAPTTLDALDSAVDALDVDGVGDRATRGAADALG